MIERVWFSAKLRYAVLAERRGLRFYMDSVRLFRAEDYDQAFLRALDIGREGEQHYANADGEAVMWKLALVVSLDKIGSVIEDNQEVYSEPIEVSEAISEAFDREFHPEASQPTQTR